MMRARWNPRDWDGRNGRVGRVAVAWLCLFGLTWGVPAVLRPAHAADEASAEAKTEVTGVVVTAAGEPAAGAAVEAWSYDRAEPVAGTTDAEGRFRLSVGRPNLGYLALLARADGGRQTALLQGTDLVNGGKLVDSIRLQLSPARRITLHVRDEGGQPVAGARVGALSNGWKREHAQTGGDGAAELWVPTALRVDTLHAWKPGVGLDYRSYVDPRRLDEKLPEVRQDFSKAVTLTLAKASPIRVTVLENPSGQPLANVPVYPWLIQKAGEPEHLNLSVFHDEFQKSTDEAGVVEFDWMPEWAAESRFTFWTTHNEFAHEPGEYHPDQSPGELTMRLNRLVPIRGRVRLPDGKPAVGVEVTAHGAGYGHDDFREGAKTDAEGRYEILATPNQLYLVAVVDKRWAAPVRDGFVVQPGQPVEAIDFDVRPATKLHGRVTAGPKGEPVAGQQIYLALRGQDLHNTPGLSLPNPDGSNRWVQPHLAHFLETDEEGRFSAFVGPGKYDVSGPSQAPRQDVVVADETEIEVNFHAPRKEKGPLSVTVTDGDSSEPAPGVAVTGIYRASNVPGLDLKAKTGEDGTFRVERYLHPVVLHARSGDGTRAAVVEIGAEDPSVTIPLRPVFAARGRLLDGTTKQPLADREIQYSVRVHVGPTENAPFRSAFGGSTTTAADGTFAFASLVAGQKYDVDVVVERNKDGTGNTWRTVTKFTAEGDASPIDLGDLTLEPAYKPPTLEQRIATAFKSKPSADERYEGALRDVRLGHLRLLLVFGDPQSEATKQFFKLRFEDKDVRSQLDHYWPTPFSTAGEAADSTAALARRLGIELPAADDLLLVIRDEAGGTLASVRASELGKDGTLDKAGLVDLLEKHAEPPLDARRLLADALERAKRENKRVMLSEGATWCGPCWQLARFLDKHRERFERDYVLLKLDHRWTGTREVVDGLHDEPSGIPWTVILDGEGKPLVDSDGPEGNFGFPSDHAGIKHFLKMLRETRRRLTDEDLSAIETALKP